jgi:hypothetical protein
MTEMDENAPQWKEGTQALGLCMICGAEYEPNAAECPECHVSLSVVRRCPECQRMVSAQHTRCVYCRTSFTHELPEEDRAMPPLGFAPRQSPISRLVRVAVVSIGTFTFVFLLGILFLREMKRPHGTMQIVARSHVIDSAKLRRTPSYRSSIAGMVTSETTLNILGVRANKLGRWIVLKWEDREVYLPASKLAAPLAADAEGGAEVLKFFIEGAGSADALKAASISVDQYVKSYPNSHHRGELRWALAERMQKLSRRGGKHRAALRRGAEAQYKLLADSHGPFAARASTVLGRKPVKGSSHSGPKQIEITNQPEPESPVASAEGRQIVILTEANVSVQPGELSSPKQGKLLSGKVAQPIEANGILAVPAGAPCRLQVVSTEAATPSLKLLSIEIGTKVYAVRSSPVELVPGEKALDFHLRAPLVIEP